MGSFIFKPEITLGALVLFAGNIFVALAFVLKKYYRSEDDAGRIEKHAQLIEAVTKAQTEMMINQGRQQSILDQMEKANGARDRRLDMVEDFVYRGGQYQTRQRGRNEEV